MKIKYLHISDPKTEKVHDTVVSLSIAPFIISNPPSQEEYDKQILANFERDLKKGTILSYEVLEEGSNNNG